MMKIKHVLLSILILGLVLFLGSCSDAVKAGEINIIQIPDGGYSFKIHQRKQAELPSSEGGVYLNIGDITKGQVQVSIIGNQKVLLEKSISNGDINSFELDGIAYKLICTDLDNKLLGEDSMDFTIINEGGSPEIDADKVKTDINYLLDQMSESNIIFIRNGKEHSGEEAASHLRMKLEKSNNLKLRFIIQM